MIRCIFVFWYVVWYNYVEGGFLYFWVFLLENGWVESCVFGWIWYVMWLGVLLGGSSCEWLVCGWSCGFLLFVVYVWLG